MSRRSCKELMRVLVLILVTLLASVCRVFDGKSLVPGAGVDLFVLKSGSV